MIHWFLIYYMITHSDIDNSSCIPNANEVITITCRGLLCWYLLPCVLSFYVPTVKFRIRFQWGCPCMVMICNNSEIVQVIDIVFISRQAERMKSRKESYHNHMCAHQRAPPPPPRTHNESYYNHINMHTHTHTHTHAHTHSEHSKNNHVAWLIGDYSQNV